MRNITYFGVYDQEDNNQKKNRYRWRVLYFLPECKLMEANHPEAPSANKQWQCHTQHPNIPQVVSLFFS
jgi:hypothetical protein